MTTFYLVVTDDTGAEETLLRAVTDRRRYTLHTTAGFAREAARGHDEALNPRVVAVDMTVRELVDLADTHTLSHNADPDTSHVPASAGAVLSERCMAVHRALVKYGAKTADELDYLFDGWPPRTAARRLSQLHAAGKVRDTGERRETRYGRPAAVWEAT